MKGTAEFLILFIPFLLIFLGSIYLIVYSSFDFLIKIIIGLIGLIAFCINVFALLVQFINFKYYKE